jgi:glycosyltransferase involved in cell wall biosynthesis
MRLIEAHAQLAEPRPVLVLPGYATPHEDELRARVSALGTAADVRFMGWVSDEDREGLYALATAFVFPSLYEGFGLPPLEAMARGVPVITTTRGSLAEVVGDAALTVDPDSVKELAEAMAVLLADHSERERLRAAGLQQAAKFSWERTAELTAASYRRSAADR